MSVSQSKFRLGRKILSALSSFFVVGVLAAPVLLAADAGVFSVSDFSGGVNAAKNARQVKDNEAKQCLNITLEEEPGSLRLRPGYHHVTDSTAAYKQIYSIYGHKFSNGDGYLFQLDQRNDSNWCDLKVSAKFGYAASESLFSYIYPERANWLTWLDNIYFFNGRNRPIIITGGPADFKADYLIPPAPGQLVAEPLPITGVLNGEYIYGAVSQVPCSTNYKWSKDVGSLSFPVIAKSEQIKLSNFYPMLEDTLCSAPGTVNILLVRTRANCNDFLKDSLFILDTLKNQTNSTSAMRTLTYNDTNSDAGFNSGSFWKTIKEATNNFPWTSGFTINDGSPPGAKNTHYTFGSPTFLDSDSGNLADTVFDNSGYNAYLEYTICLMDTVNGRISDTAHSLIIIPTSFLHKVKIGLPIAHAGYARLILRRTIEEDPNSVSSVIYDAYYCLDTIRNDTQTTYIDIKEEDWLYIHNEAYERNVPDANFKGAIIHEGRMFAWDDHRIYYSKSDTGGQWAFFDNIECDMDDGDRIINLASREGYIICYKTKSIYIIYTTDGFVTHRTKKSPGIGMIAPYSLRDFNGAAVFLGERGVNLETGNIYRDNSLERKTLSDNIRSICIRGVDSMAEAAAGLFNDQYLLSYPGTDTTMVYYFGSGGWSLWSFDFLQMTEYDTVNSSNFTPFNEVVFIKPGSGRIFSLSAADSTDEGAVYEAVYEKIFPGSGFEKLSPQSLSLWAPEFDDGSDTIEVNIYDEKARLLAEGEFLGEDTSAIFQYINLVPIDNQSGHYLDVKLTLPGRKWTVSGIDLITIPAGIDKGGN